MRIPLPKSEYNLVNKLTIIVSISMLFFSGLFIYDNKSIGSSINQINFMLVDLPQHAMAQMTFLPSLSPQIISSGSTHPGKISIGIVFPTFTAAAYNNSFYRFYSIYHVSGPLPTRNVTANLNLLSGNVTNPKISSLTKHNLVTNQTSGLFFLSNYLKMALPLSNIHNLADPDIDNSSIFMKNGVNKYHILIIGHQEYVTQREYDNLKLFVANGGTLIILDGNVFYAEVKYDTKLHTVTLVKGHSWAFNGKSAWRSVNERWWNETAKWVGSNFYAAPITTFINNPFHYTHFEEQFVINPEARIIMNYDAVIPSAKNLHFSGASNKPIIATYEMNYQKGKVIVFGIDADRVITNDKFLKFFNRILLEHTLIDSKTTVIENISSRLVSNAISGLIASKQEQIVSSSLSGSTASNMK